MPVSRITPHCLQIRRFAVVNCYLVDEPDGLTLIDTALAAARIIREGARYMGKPIRRIALTHAHMDHVGSVNALRKLLAASEIDLISSEREYLLLEEANRGIKPKNMKLLSNEPQDPVKGGFRKLAWLPNLKVREGDKIGSLRVVNTPGHTPGHIAFLDERDGTLFAGDSLFNLGGFNLPFVSPWYLPIGKYATWHFPTALASGRKLAAIEPKRVLVGHGPTVENASVALHRAVQRGEAALRTLGLSAAGASSSD